MSKLQLQYRDKEFTCNTAWSVRDRRIRTVKMPCGGIVETRGDKGQLLSPHMIDTIAKQHVYKCVSCELALLGEVRRNVMNQDDVGALFVRGIDGKRSKTGNLTSQDGILEHYSTIEAIRMLDGKVINNSQCWSSGFACCPRLEDVKYALPLTTIEKHIVERDDIVGDLILQTKGDSWSDAIFRIRHNNLSLRDRADNKMRQFWYHQYWLDELPELCNTSAEAEQIFKPLEVVDAERAKIKHILDQGEWWFIPLDGLTDKEVIGVTGARNKTYTTNTVDGMGNPMTIESVAMTYDDLQYLDKPHNHRVTKVGSITYDKLERHFRIRGQAPIMVRVAKGNVVHTSARWRKRMKLGDGNTWHAVFKNRSLRWWHCV